jgi:hypothetical protein
MIEHIKVPIPNRILFCKAEAPDFIQAQFAIPIQQGEAEPNENPYFLRDFRFFKLYSLHIFS